MTHENIHNDDAQLKSAAHGEMLLILSLALVAIFFSVIAPPNVTLVSSMPEFSHYGIAK